MAKTVLSLLILTTVTVCGIAAKSKHWAVIVAGSNGWFNYRHQADACHAYQIIRKNGIPEDQIITMMYDDIADNPANPTKGIIINRPGGPDVYQGVNIDYNGKHVSPENFLNVLSGNKKAMVGIGTGRVLESGPDDHVFVNFVDHGGPGILAFGREFLHAADLHKTIKKMHSKDRYAQMVFYVEACESGSIFANNLLPKDINVFATTASNPKEPSYACYMDKRRKTYLGDVYSVKWMEDSDKEDLSTETLTKQFHIVKREVNTSHVQEYGDLSLGSVDVGEFQGKDKEMFIVGKFDKDPLPDPNVDAVRSEDVELSILKLELDLADTPMEREVALHQLEQATMTRHRTRATFKHVVALSVNHDASLVRELMTIHSDLHSLDCYQPVLEHLKDTCKGLNLVQNDYGLRQLYTLVNLCELPTPIEVIKEAINTVAEYTDLCEVNQN